MMTRTDADIVKDWKERLRFRLELEKTAKEAHTKAQKALIEAREKDIHPRKHLVEARDAASDKLSMRRRQIAEARRIIARHSRGNVHSPIEPILAHSNGWAPGHDGVDLISEASDEGWAICDGVIVRADASGWWGKGAVASHGHPISDGDGIVILKCTIDKGPFKKGMLFGYGHAENAKCDVGDVVKAGQVICHAGFARAWHFHFMVNAGTAQFWDGQRPRGVGDRNPWPFIQYARDNS
jgi:murein DD-endopeptidase MepM/ murein hydrolase activator NlpD